MNQVIGAYRRDENFVPITNLGIQITKAVTFDAGTTGAVGTTTLFKVTGTVALNVFGFCTADLTGSGTIEIGVDGSTACLADQNSATSIDNHDVWYNSVLAIGGKVAGDWHVINQDVIQTIAGDTITGGTLTYYCEWVPLSSDGNVTLV